MTRRLGIAGVFALIAGGISWRAEYVVHGLGGDYLMIWRATHIVLDGGDPYKLMWWMKFPALHTPFNYPLPAVGLGLAFVWMRPEDAAIAFAACSAGLLGYALTADGFARVPLALSAPFVFAAQLSQTSFAILALALIPAAAGMTVMKPNIGLALFAWRPRLRTAIVGGILVAGTVAISPQWPFEWLAWIRTSPTHHSPAFGVGAVTLLALIKWRRPEARLLAAMAVIPHGLYFYDELPLWLVARTRREAMFLSGASWLGWLGWVATSGGATGPLFRDMAPWIVLSLYLPCLIMILRRPNVPEAEEAADHEVGAAEPTAAVASASA